MKTGLQNEQVEDKLLLIVYSKQHQPTIATAVPSVQKKQQHSPPCLPLKSNHSLNMDVWGYVHQYLKQVDELCDCMRATFSIKQLLSRRATPPRGRRERRRGRVVHSKNSFTIKTETSLPVPGEGLKLFVCRNLTDRFKVFIFYFSKIICHRVSN